MAMLLKSFKMKKIIFAITFLIFALITNAQITKVEIMATGLTCSMCSNAINKQLKTIAEVEKVDIDLNKNLFVVTLKSDNNLTPKTFKDKVEKAGFFVGSMVLFMNFNNQAVEDNKQMGNYIFIDTKAQTLNGLTKVKLLDKGYVTTKEYKKLAKSLAKYDSYQKDNEDDFHLKAM
jgi:copper chaperone CopZ